MQWLLAEPATAKPQISTITSQETKPRCVVCGIVAQEEFFSYGDNMGPGRVMGPLSANKLVKCLEPTVLGLSDTMDFSIVQTGCTYLSWNGKKDPKAKSIYVLCVPFW